MIALVIDEDLGLVDEAAKSPRVDDPIPVPLKFAAIRMGWLGINPAAASALGRRVALQAIGHIESMLAQ